MPENVNIAQVRRALIGPLPGPSGQMRMSARPRSQAADYGARPAPRPGAVLLLLYPMDGRLWLPLTRRSANLSHHGGQISLPGGRVEPRDPSWWHGALREAHEECGIIPGAVSYVGALTPLYVPPSNYEVHPFVGFTPTPPVFQRQAEEVDEIIVLSLDRLLDPAGKGEREGLWDGRQRRVPYYRGARVAVPPDAMSLDAPCADEIVIWGATAMILSELEVALSQTSH